MKRNWIVASATGTMLTLLVPMAAFGQQREGGPGQPPPPGQDSAPLPRDDRGGPDMPPPPPGRDRGPADGQPGMPGGPRGMQGGPRDQGPPRQGGRGPAGFGGVERPMQTPFDNQRAYLDLVDRFTRLSHDPETAAVAGVIMANELMRPKGAEATIAYFDKLLADTKSEAVRRAIRLHLIDLYRASGQGDKALAEVEQLIKGAAPQK